MEYACVTKSRVIIVANRLPVSLSKNDKGEWVLEQGSGGLVTAMAPVLKNRGGLWIGWAGNLEEDDVDTERYIMESTGDSGYALKPVVLNLEEKTGFYYGFSNEIIWPLFHDLQTRCNFDPTYWQMYLDVNYKFADVVYKNIQPGDYIWVHDYHLMHVAQALRDKEVDQKIGFFLHTPFPPLDIFLKLPWRFHILKALLEYDLIGFQTIRDKRNFVQCVRSLLKDVSVRSKGPLHSIKKTDREVIAGAFPISIDFEEFASQAASEEVAETAWYIHETLPDRQLILGIDRMDYTKGIPERLEALRRALIRFPELRGQITLVQVAVPSREEIPKYQDLKLEIEQLVSDINGKFTQAGWVPIHYISRSINRQELLAYYRTAEIALITPLKDGMNLVAKEFCAASHEEESVLILSEFAGAASQLYKWALMVNPYNVEGVADAIYKAFKMSRQERRSRMRYLRHSIKRQNIFKWLDSFLNVAISKNLDDFPVTGDFVPFQ